MGFRPILPLFIKTKNLVLAISCSFASKSASGLKMIEKASGRKENRENENRKQYTHLGLKTQKFPQRMAENLFKYSDKRGETG